MEEGKELKQQLREAGGENGDMGDRKSKALLTKRFKINLLCNTRCKVARGSKSKQGRTHDNPVADGWAGAIIQKLLAILGNISDGRTNRHGKV